MRRLALIAVGAVVVVAAVYAIASAVTGGSGGAYKINALFDDAGFMHQGEDVKIAGAKVGTVTDITLSPAMKADIQMQIDPRFAPFHADADCTIVPESLIGERYVSCTPGTPSAAAITATAGQTPTVPLSDTHSPVDADLVLDTFNQPTRTRLALFINELGAGLAGRSSDLNAAILRANPALQSTDATLAILDHQRADLQALIGASNNILGQLAAHGSDVTGFIDQAEATTAVTATHSSALEQTIHNLPALLSAARPALTQLQGLAQAGTPVITTLGAAAPALTSVAQQLGPFSDAALPALRHLANASRTGTAVAKVSTPVVAHLRTVAAQAGPSGKLLAQLLESMQREGAFEGLISFDYYAAAATARFDSTSHFLPAYALASPCSVPATTPLAGCNARFAAAPAERAAARAAVKRGRAVGRARAPSSAQAPTAGAAPAPQQAPSQPGSGAPGSGTPGAPNPLPPSLQIGPLNVPLPNLGPLLGTLTGHGQAGPQGGGGGSSSNLNQLLGYLLG